MHEKNKKDYLKKQMEHLESLMNNWTASRQYPINKPNYMFSNPMQMGIISINPIIMQHMMRNEMMLRDIFMTTHEIYRIVLQLREHEFGEHGHF